MNSSEHSDRVAVRERVAPLVWTFDGSFGAVLTDMEAALGRAILQIEDASRIAVLIRISLPQVKAALQTGDKLQPAWSTFLRTLPARFNLPAPPRVRFTEAAGPLATLVVVYGR